MHLRSRLFRRLSSPLSAALLALAGTLTAPAAQAALPYGSASYVLPSAEVGPDEVIDVLMRLELDPASSPLVFGSFPLSGFDAADLPTQGTWYSDDGVTTEIRDFAVIEAAILNVFFTCSGNFTDGCGPGASYSFSFWFGGPSGPPSLVGASSFSLLPGESTEFLLGRFAPTEGGAAPGTYRFYSAGVLLGFVGRDALGDTLLSDNVTLATACPTATDDCAFTRTVTAVPEPGTLGLWATGLTVAGWMRRRRG